ncbi:MAG: amidase [Gemmatimonadota bacterium]
MPHLDRRRFLEAVSVAGVGGALLPRMGGPLFPGVLYAQAVQEGGLSTETIAAAEKILSLEFTEEQRELMLQSLERQLDGFETLRSVELPNSVPPAFRFDPRPGPGEDGGPTARAPGLAASPAGQGAADGQGAGVRGRPAAPPADTWKLPETELPRSEEDLSFLSAAELAVLLRDRKVSSTHLTRLYLDRLKRYGPVLEAVVTLTEERALDRAGRADEELDAGEWRGPLHGVPWGAKDLLAVAGYPTTWGAAPYKDQVIDRDAAVVERLDAAGAVLVAKLTLGALAQGDVWFGGRTKNPWNIEQGSSGSSAGPGATVAAGLVGFAIGTETLGSIVSPSTRNGVTGLRPTFGRVSRHGAMALSWTMDKLGPMCRSAEDCALVFAAIHGRDLRDPSAIDAPFTWDPDLDVTRLRVGYVEAAFEEAENYRNREADLATLEVLEKLGVELLPISLPEDPPAGPLLITLSAEAAAAFDELTRSGGVDEMVRQGAFAWPNTFRRARFVPAVEYINANRARTRLISAMAETMKELDAFVSPSFRGGTLRITNLTGHPSVVVPNAFHPVEGQPPSSPRRSPASITFVGNLYREDAALALAHAFQRETDFHRRRPPIA